MEKSIYLDNAATSFPKPPAVLAAWQQASLTAGGNPGRSGHRLAMRAAEEVFACREAVANFFGSSSPEHVVFTYNATYALNLAIRALVRHGDHVLISNLEHNAVYRPIYALASAGEIRFDLFDGYGDENAVLARISEKLRPNTRLVVTLHRSNLCGITLPVGKIGRMLAAKDICYIVDASQSAGICPIEMEKMGITALCAPGHKGLYGPAGTGFLLWSESATQRGSKLRPTIVGGTGVHSLEPFMPQLLPERFEAGTLAAPALAALRAGIETVQSIGIQTLAEKEDALYRYAIGRLTAIPCVRVYAPEVESGNAVLFNVEHLSPEDVVAILDTHGICVRGGLHCAPLAHKRLGTAETGAVRIGFGMYNTKSDVDFLCDVIESI